MCQTISVTLVFPVSRQLRTLLPKYLNKLRTVPTIERCDARGSGVWQTSTVSLLRPAGLPCDWLQANGMAESFRARYPSIAALIILFLTVVLVLLTRQYVKVSEALLRVDSVSAGKSEGKQGVTCPNDDVLFAVELVGDRAVGLIGCDSRVPKGLPGG